jgi:OOP family OmpA-OmpF porin
MTCKYTLKTCALPLTLAAGILAPLASVQAVQPGVYMGVGTGSAHDVILDEDESAFKFHGGVNLTHNIGLEIAYVDLGSYLNDSLNQDGISYEVIGYLPLSPQLDLYGRAGFFDWEVSDSFGYSTGTDPTFGIGLQAQLQHHLSLRGEYQTFLDVAGGDVDLYSASINLHF